MTVLGISLWFFLFPIAALFGGSGEGWVGSVSAKHSYISPIKSNVIMGAGLSLCLNSWSQSAKSLFIGTVRMEGREGGL